MFWCHNCQIRIQSVEQVRCEVCSCEAIELLSSQNNPQYFQPYVSPISQEDNHYTTQTDQNASQTSNQRPSIFTSFMRDPSGMEMMQNMSPMGGIGLMSTILNSIDDKNTPIYIRYTVTRPVFGILLLNSEDEEKVSVPQQRINSLQKVQIKQQCVICQQKGGSGLRLPCNHEFHQNCIKPWFQEANTCPSCRRIV